MREESVEIRLSRESEVVPQFLLYLPPRSKIRPRRIEDPLQEEWGPRGSKRVLREPY